MRRVKDIEYTDYIQWAKRENNEKVLPKILLCFGTDLGSVKISG